MWEPISLAELFDEISKRESAMRPEILNLWQLIKIHPIRWQETTHGEEGGGFWVVAIFGKKIIWYNDIEDGFNVSTYQQYGLIDQYCCNQDPLDLVINRLTQF
jgi:hypothetical protein